MFKHLFKLIWNKRRQNFLFLSEIFVSFLVIFALCSMLVYYLINYSKPPGFEYERVWNVRYSNPFKSENKDSLQVFYENIRRNILAFPQVKEVTFTSANFPYSTSHSTTGITFKGQQISMLNFYQVEDDYQKVLNMQVLEGRWFNKSDASGKKAIVINSSMRKKLFGEEAAVGKVIGDYDDKNPMRIIGVVADVKADGDFQPAGPGFYNRMDTTAFNWIDHMLIQVNADADAAFESRLSKKLSQLMKNSDLEIQHLTEMRDAKNGNTVMPMIICLMIAGFLIINVALGLFGVLWYSISQRRAEIGLRMAIGASRSAVSKQLVAEALVLTTLSLAVGVFFAIQFPILHVFNVPALVYIIALLTAMAFVYILVFICALYPGRQAAAIQPAVALHEE
ncbi:ABC transporter permease [Pedobacter faecalis]|uniref:ABC transporter permease n=1 Tax=Pedobacter faecalis TaxID=3041495 RepID=UPI00254C2DBA|nr:ABC transporter permease [Pedobacter sp. ELA7]